MGSFFFFTQLKLFTFVKVYMESVIEREYYEIFHDSYIRLRDGNVYWVKETHFCKRFGISIPVLRAYLLPTSHSYEQPQYIEYLENEFSWIIDVDLAGGVEFVEEPKDHIFVFSLEKSEEILVLYERQFKPIDDTTIFHNGKIYKFAEKRSYPNFKEFEKKEIFS